MDGSPLDFSVRLGDHDEEKVATIPMVFLGHFVGRLLRYFPITSCFIF